MTLRIPLKNMPKGLMASMTNTEDYLHSLGFDQPLLSLIRCHASQLNGCEYCLNMHHREALSAGLSSDKLGAMTQWVNAAEFSAKERAVLLWTEQLTRIKHEALNEQGELEDRTEQNLSTSYEHLQAFFSQEEIANLSLAITQINSWNRLVKAFGFEVVRN
ncbi:MAG: alkylhydroperoxidase [Alteromonadaceae bacterium]|nr:MAG: alkylhydroperoxidase [Alteromonadaceae bacterium]